VRAAENVLRVEGIDIQTRDTGGRSGRTVKFYIADGRVTVKSLGQGVQVLVLAMDTEMSSTKMNSHNTQREICHA